MDAQPRAIDRTEGRRACWPTGVAAGVTRAAAAVLAILGVLAGIAPATVVAAVVQAPLRSATAPRSADSVAATAPERIYVIDSWETGDGLPENSATAMVQDRTGYLWFGTFDGLVRFDGVRFEVFDRHNTGHRAAPETSAVRPLSQSSQSPQSPDSPSSSGLPDSRIANLHLDRLGRLWVSTLGGLVRREGDEWRRIGAAEGWTGDAVRSFTEREDGAMLLTSFDGRAFEFDGTRFTQLPDPPALPDATPPSTAMVGAVDAQGRWWVVRRGFAGTWDGAGWRALEGVDALRPGIGCASARDGGIWIVSGESVRKYHGLVEQFAVEVPSLPTGIWSTFEDGAGHLWVSTIDSGVHRITFETMPEPRARIVTWDMDRGLTHNAIRFVFEDREQNLWVGSSGGGLMRFRTRRVEAYTRGEGLTERVVRSVCPTNDGSVLVGTYGKGLFRIEDGRATPIPVAADGMNPQYIQCVLRDREGRTWVGTFADGLFVIEGAGTRRVELPPACGANVLALFEDRSGRIWISGGMSIAVVEAGEVLIPPSAIGPALEEVIAFAELDDGSMLVTNRRTVHRLEAPPSGRGAVDSTKIVELLRPDGTPLDDVASLTLRADGAVWMGTSRSGLLCWSPRGIRVIDGRSGLPARGVYALLDDANGHCWLATDRGIVRVRRDHLDALADGTRSTARWIRLGPDDGMPSLECSGGRQPVCGTDPTGRLWFATPRGVAMVNPATFVANDLPPPLVIESVSFVVSDAEGTAQERRVELDAAAGRGSSGAGGGTDAARPLATPSITLPPDLDRLEIRYTALSLCDPAATPFQIMMEGLDRTWRDVGTARSVDYDRPPPGNYRFRMRAANNDGLWAEHAASVDLVLTPTLWQRRWVQVAAALGAVLICAGGAWWIAQLRFERRRRIEERFHRVVEAAPNAMIMVDSSGRIAMVNEQAEREFGYTRSELVGASIDLLLVEGARDAHAGMRREFMSNPVARPMAAGRELFGRRKDGTSIPLEIGLAPIHWDDGTSVLASIVNLTQRKAQERERELQLNQLAHLSRVAVLGELSGALAHELNQPLTAILSNAQAAQRLMRRTPDAAIDLVEIRAILGDIIDQDKRAGEVIHRLRALLRKGESELRPVRVDEIVHEATRLVRNELMGHGVDVRVEMARDLPMVLGDRVQLQQVLVNLLVNADDAMQEVGSGAAAVRRIIVGAAVRGAVVDITVSDSGPGLGCEALQRLFEPFFTTKTKGLGLGLAICRSIVEAHGGSLAAENLPDGGAAFRFELPVHAAPGALPSAVADPGEFPSREPRA